MEISEDIKNCHERCLHYYDANFEENCVISSVTTKIPSCLFFKSCEKFSCMQEDDGSSSSESCHYVENLGFDFKCEIFENSL